MIYQAVVTKNNPFSYEITVTYEGKVTKKDPVYLYTIEYEKIEDEILKYNLKVLTRNEEGMILEKN